MRHLRITSSHGATLGIYAAATVAEALDAMARDAGYRDQADAVARGVAPFSGILTDVVRCRCGGGCGKCDADGWSEWWQGDD